MNFTISNSKEKYKKKESKRLILKLKLAYA